MASAQIAVSRLGEDDSREAQNSRAVHWLLMQAGGSIVVVTPRSDVPSASIRALLARSDVVHHSWRGFAAGSFANQRVLYAWPDRKHLNDVWNSAADAVAVIEWGKQETTEWIDDVNPTQLLPHQTISPELRKEKTLEALPNGVDGILEYIAEWAAGYDSGLKWNEEDKLKADMMNRPARWAPIAVEDVRAKCRQLGMRPADVDTLSGLLQRRKDGRRFNVRSSYRTFQFD